MFFESGIYLGALALTTIGEGREAMESVNMISVRYSLLYVYFYVYLSEK